MIITPETLYELISAKFKTCFDDFSALKPADRPKSPPYCAILIQAPSNVSADNKNYYNEPRYNVELYTSRTDYESAGILEGIFEENDIYYERSATYYIREENKMQIIYSI